MAVGPRIHLQQVRLCSKLLGLNAGARGNLHLVTLKLVFSTEKHLTASWGYCHVSLDAGVYLFYPLHLGISSVLQTHNTPSDPYYTVSMDLA